MVFLRACSILICVLFGACRVGSTDIEATGFAGSGPGDGTSVEIGVPDPEGTLAFVPLEDGGDIPLETFGQGGMHATLAVRCVGFGNQAWVDVSLENLVSGEIVETTPSARPPLLLCREDLEIDGHQVCDLIPLHVLTGGLADPDDKDGLPVRVTATVRNEAGFTNSTTIDGVLRLN